MTTPEKKPRPKRTPEQRERDRIAARAKYEREYKSLHVQTKSGIPDPSLVKKGVSMEADLLKLRAHPAAKTDRARRFGG